MNPRFWLPVAFLMSRIGLAEAAGQCRPSVYSEYGMYLRGHTFKTVQARFPGECSLRCEQDVRCQSFNVIIGPIVCELNSRTKEARPEDFVPDQYRFYMKRTKNRGTFRISRDVKKHPVRVATQCLSPRRCRCIICLLVNPANY